MMFPFLIFIVVAGSIIGGYYAIAYLPGYYAARQLDRRLRDEVIDVTLPGEELPLGHLHPITQGRLHGVQNVRRGHEDYVRQVKGYAKIVIAEAVVLFGIEYFEQRR